MEVIMESGTRWGVVVALTSLVGQLSVAATGMRVL